MKFFARFSRILARLALLLLLFAGLSALADRYFPKDVFLLGWVGGIACMILGDVFELIGL